MTYFLIKTENSTFRAVNGGSKVEDCLNCIPGSYASSPGSSSCDLCPPGSWSGQGASGCTDCAAGYAMPYIYIHLYV